MEPGARVDVDECGWKLAIWLSRFFPTANIIFIVVMHVILAAIAGTRGVLCNLPLDSFRHLGKKNVAELQCDMTATASALIIHEDVALFELQNAREIDFSHFFFRSRRISGMHEMRKCLPNAFASCRCHEIRLRKAIQTAIAAFSPFL